MAEENDGSFQDLEGPDLFTYFAEKAFDVTNIMESFQLLKNKLGIGEDVRGISLYFSLKSKLTHWKAKSLWEVLDKKVQLSDYKQQKSCEGMKVAVVGCGPVGMRFAVEAALLGCDVYVVDKRSYFSRNNVLHLWPFTIDDLKRFGAKKFYGQFCAGAIDHVSIRSLQSILLKVCLLLGVKIFFNVEFIKIEEPGNGRGWHAEFKPSNHLLNEIDFKVLVGAEGKNSRIPGFDRKELRAKLALAITANFVNNKTQEEAAIQEISGVAFIFNQKFFKDLKEDTGIDLENILYYKNDTHYFIMTAKKDSLLDKGVLKEDYSDINLLLAPSNRNIKAMQSYAREAADWSTGLPDVEFALNHKGEPDVDLFDFTSIYQAEYSAKAIRRHEEDLIVCLVGDSLVQPFWPQGTGCARGFLSAMDAAWMVKGYGEGRGILDLLAERESLFQRLTQTKSESLMKKFSAYTIDPRTRYSNLNLLAVKPGAVKKLYDFDGEFPLQIEAKPSPQVSANVSANNKRSTPTKTDNNIKTKPEATPPTSFESPKKTNAEPHPKLKKTPSRPINEAGHVTRALFGTPEEDTKILDRNTLLLWYQGQVRDYPVRVNDLYRSFRDGLILCSLIHRYNPEIIPQYQQLTSADPLTNNRIAFSLLYEHYNIQQLIKPSEMDRPDRLALFTYLSTVYEAFQEVDLPAKKEESSSANKKMARRMSKRKSSKALKVTIPTESWNTQTSSLRRSLSPRKQSKREKKNDKELSPLHKSTSKPEGATPLATPTPKKEVPKKETSKKETPLKNEKASANVGGAQQRKKVDSNNSSAPRPVSTFGAPTSTSDVCFFCNKRVYLMERMSANGVFFHRNCFRCSHCGMQLSMGNFAMSKGENGLPGKFFCKPHYRQLFMANPEAINYARSQPDKQKTVSPPVSPVKTNLETIGEDEVVVPAATADITKEEEEEMREEIQEANKRRRTLTQRLSAYWKRRKSKSKSTSPEKFSDSEKLPEPILFESPPTPPSPSSPTTPSTPATPPIIIPDLQVSGKPEPAEERFHHRSPPVLTARPGSTPPPKVSGSLMVSQKGRGQTSIVRPLLLPEEEDEIALEERQKQQERFREAQSIQREMSQIELQYEELEDIAREVEQNLRDAEGTAQEDNFMKAWLNLVAEKNSLVRRTSELSMQMKILELEDKKCELEKEMRDIQDSNESQEQFDKLLEELVDVIEEKDNIIQQVEMDRITEIEEAEAQATMMSDHFGLEPSPRQERRPSTVSEGAVADYNKAKKEKVKRSSWWKPW